MKTILETLELGELYLQKKGIERPRREAEDLLGYALNLPRLELYLNFERPLVEEELEKSRALFQRRGRGEPFAYIVGQVSFHNLTLQVTPATLIPRPETELLVEKIIRDLEKVGALENKLLVDMCTGSGCIGLALKKHFPQLRVALTDISPEALKVAEENARLNALSVELWQGNLFEAIPKLEKIDFFVSNPPYISSKEYLELSPQVRDFEPKLALVAGEEGLNFYHKIAARLHEFFPLKAWLEIGHTQREELTSIFKNYSIEFQKDYSAIDRFLIIS